MAIAVPMTERWARNWVWFPRLALPLMMGVILFVLTSLHLPHDRLSMLIARMMALNNPGYWIHLFAFALIHLCSLTLLAVAAWTPWLPRLRSTATKYGPALCLLLLYNLFIFRVTTNIVYAMLPNPYPMGPTDALVALEGTFLEWLHRELHGPALAYACSVSYSTIWLGSMTLLQPALIYRDGGEILDDMVKFLLLAPLLALPIYAVLPILDPWVLNRHYGVFDVFRYTDYPALTESGRDLLRQVATTGPESTSPKLPSFHIVYPFGIAIFLWRCGFRWLSSYFAVLTAWTAFVIVYLGRHFVTDIPASILFALGVIALVDRLRWSVLLPTDPRFPPAR